MLKKVASGEYLDLVNLDFSREQTSKAFLLGVRNSNTVVGNPFLIFHLKDINGHNIPGFFFAVNDLSREGITALAMKKRPVIITYLPQNRDGSISLLLRSIEAFNGEFDYEKFLSREENADQLLTDLNLRIYNILEGQDYELFNLSESLTTKTFTDLANGKVGAYVRFCKMVLESVMVYEGLPNIDIKDLVKVTATTLRFYYLFLEANEKIEVNLKHKNLEMLGWATFNISDARLKNIVTDVVASLVLGSNPEHLYANIVYNAITRAKETMLLAYTYPLIMEGSSRKVGDVVLARY